MENIISDDKNYYFFHAYERGDYENSEGLIIADSTRNANKKGQYGKYNRESKPTLKEVYEHIRMRANLDTNCISFTKDASVAITYDTYGKSIVIKIPKEKFGTDQIFDAAEYLMTETEKAVSRELEEKESIRAIIDEIENAKSKEQIKEIFDKYSLGNSISAISDRQYMRDEEQLRIVKLYTKVRLIEKNDVRKFKDHLIPGEDNSRLLRTIANAYTSTEIIHYGDVPKDIVYNCPNVFLDMFSLLEQATEQAKQDNDTNRISAVNQLNNRLMELVIEGYDVDTKTGMLTNGKEELNLGLTRSEIYDITKELTRRDEIERDISIEKAFEITGGDETFNNTKMQVMSSTIMAEAINKKRIIEKVLKQLFKDIEIEDILKDTYCLSKDLIIKQNGRGYKIANTVNILISQYGQDLDYEDTKRMIDILNGYSSEELEKISQLGIDYEDIQDLLVVKNKRDISRNKIARKGKELDYYAEAIIEGFDWRKKRTLRTSEDKEKDEKYKLKQKILSGIDDAQVFINVFDVLQNQGYNQQQTLAIIMNMAIDGKLRNVPYSQIMNLEKNELEKVLTENSSALQTSLEIVNLDILMGRGKAREQLKSKLLEIGVNPTTLDEKDEKNIYFAYKIVNGYNFDMQLTNKEKASLIENLLRLSSLNKNDTEYISNVYNEMETQLNLSKQDIYGIIINMAVNGSAIDENGFSYSYICASYKNKIFELRGKEDKLNTNIDEATIASAIGELTKRVKKELLDYGIDEEFINSKDAINVITAKQIVDQYKFDRELLDIEKGLIINKILESNQLNKNDVGNLKKVYLDMGEQLSLSNQEICGAIINMAINSNSTGMFAYSGILHSPRNTIPLLKGREKEIDTKVTEDTILKATGLIPEQLKEKIIKQSGRENLFEQMPLRNIMAIQEIINEYDYGRELADEERKGLYDSFFKTKRIVNNDGLATILANLKNKTNFSRQEIYGMMINMAVYGNATNDNETMFSLLLTRPNVAIQRIEERRNQIKSKVDDYTIAYISEKMPENIEKELRDLGIQESILEDNYAVNIIQVKEIVDAYKEELSLSKEEQVKLMEKFLSYAHLKTTTYPTVINGLQQKLDISEKDAYGILINSLIAGEQVNIKDLINMPNITLEKIIEENIPFKTEVNEETIFNITGIYSKKSISELEEIGLPEEYLEAKSPENVLFAKEMIENISKERELSTLEKRCIMQSVLDYSTLDKGQSGRLKNVQRELKNVFELDDRQAYKLIINMANNIVTTTNYNISKLINAPGTIERLKQNDAEEVDCELSDATIAKAVSYYINDEEKEEVKEELRNIGISEQILKEKSDYNIYFASHIINSYDFNKQLTDIEKKALITQMLDTVVMEPKYKVQLANTVINLEKNGLQTQEAYGLMINLACKPKVIEGQSYGYTSILSSSQQGNLIANKVEHKDTIVTRQLIAKAISDTTDKSEKNEYTIYDILNNRDLGIELSTREKAAVFQMLTRNAEEKRAIEETDVLLGEYGLDADESARGLINLILDNNLVDEGNFSSAIVLNSSNKVDEIFKKNMKLNLEVSRETIDKAVCDTLTEEEIKAIKQKYIDLGIEQEFIERKKPRNLYMAQKILERSTTATRCTDDKMKSKVLINILNSTALDTDDVLDNRLINLLSNIRKSSESDENIYDIFIVLSLDNVQNSTKYSEILRKTYKVLEQNINKENLANNNIECIKTMENIRISNKIERVTVEEEQIEKSKQEMQKLGINLEKYDSIDERNFPALMQIINEYKFDEHVTDEDKIAIVDQILDSAGLQDGAKIEKLIKNMKETGMNEQEVYGSIINLAINKSAKKKGISYSILLDGKKNGKKEDFETEVTDELITTARINKKMKEKFSAKDIKTASNIFKERSTNKKIIENASDENICTAMMIAEKIEFTRELTIQEKTSIAENLLNNTNILRAVNYPYLTRMIVTLEDKGMTEQEVCKGILNLCTNQSSQKKGLSYSVVLKNQQLLSQIQKEDLNFEITEGTIRKNCINAKRENITEEMQEEAYQKALRIGIPVEFLEDKDKRNIYEGLEIFENYQFDRELSEEEKLVVVQSLLSCSKLNKGKGNSFSNLKGQYAEIGLTEEEICGTIINTALGNTNKGYSMAKILPNAKVVLEIPKEEIHTVVEDKYIQKAVQKRRKSLETMKGAVVNLKKDNNLSEIEIISNEIETLCEEKNETAQNRTSP